MAQRDDVTPSHDYLSLSTSAFTATTANALKPRYLVPAAAPTPPRMVSVRFSLKFKTNWGQGVKLIGSHPKMGKCAGIGAQLRMAGGNKSREPKFESFGSHPQMGARAWQGLIRAGSLGEPVLSLSECRVTRWGAQGPAGCAWVGAWGRNSQNADKG